MRKVRFLWPLVTLFIAATGCSAGFERGPAVPKEGEVRRAALARVTIDNRTAHRLSIAFEAMSEPGREVVVGGVAGGDTVRVAPVLAGEPIVLVARTEEGSEYRLPARTLEVDAEWLWMIPEDAPFIASSPTRGTSHE